MTQSEPLLPYKPARCNKADWPSGHWQREDDIKAWNDVSTGYACAILRHPSLGHLCGYVQMPASHPLYTKSYNQRAQFPKKWLDRKLKLAQDIGVISVFCASVNISDDMSEATLDLIFHCHGGLTYGRDGWLGFDCGHAGDLTPCMTFFAGEDKYRDMLYVTAQCERLAEQLSEYQQLMQSANVNT